MPTLRPPQVHELTLPEELQDLGDPQTALPRIARDTRLMGLVQAAVAKLSSEHQLVRGDARGMSELAPNSVHLVLTSPPYLDAQGLP